MSHYRTGTAAYTNNSIIVIGTGTDWISGAAPGECIKTPDGKLVEILSIQSATQLTMGEPYLGATASGQAYSIVPTQSYIRDLASQAATLVNTFPDTAAYALRKDAADKATIVDADKLGGRDSVSGLAKLFSFATIKTELASWLNGGTLPIAVTTLSATGPSTLRAVTNIAPDASDVCLTSVNVGNVWRLQAFNVAQSVVRDIVIQDQGGSVGIGAAPSAWSGIKGLGISAAGSVYADGIVVGNLMGVTQNAYYSSGWKYRNSSIPAGQYEVADNTHTWYSSTGAQIAGAAITWVQAMQLDASRNLLVGVLSGACHTIAKSSVSAGNLVLQIGGADIAGFYPVDAFAFTAANAANAAVKLGSCVSGRSLNAHGTVNASGADYAEYERNNGLTIGKGSIVGFKADGTLTDIFAEAMHFGIKSTNPSYVGGDTWGSEDQVGKRPDEPQFTPAPYTGPQAPTKPGAVAPIADDATQEQIDAHAEALGAYAISKAAYDAALRTYTMDTAQHIASVEVSKNLFDTAAYPEYLRAKSVFEAALEAARQLVDRIAYSGKVPCNVQGATPGGYIIAMDDAGAIAGEFVADPDFAQYKKAVGRVNRILPDGRCEVAVIIH